MSLKPEQIGRNTRYLTRKAAARARRDAKKATTRLMRRAVAVDPESAPTHRVIRGYAS